MLLTQISLSTNALNSSDQPSLQLVLYRDRLSVRHLLWNFGDDTTILWPWKEVHQINHAFLMDISGLENVGGRKILLFSSIGLVLRRSDAEVAALIFVEESAEDGWRVEVWPADMSAFCPCAGSFGRADEVCRASINLCNLEFHRFGASSYGSK